MKSRIMLLLFTPFLFISCKKDNDDDKGGSLNCVEYWAQIPFANFCGLSSTNFDYNTIPQDICNADQNSTYAFDDLVSIRIYNNFSNSAALEEYNAEEDDAQSLNGYTSVSNLGDKGFAVITTGFGELDFAIVQSVKGTFTLYLEVNGNAANGANNCFDETSVIDFARALMAPL